MANISQSILRRIRELYDQPGASLEQLTDTLKNFNRGEVAEIRPSGAGMRKLSRDERVRQMTQGALDNLGGGGMGALGVIKGKGGNWLTGSVENSLSGLKRHIPDEVGARARMNMPPLSPEDLAHIQRATAKEQTLNNWIEGPLTKYVKRDMATEGDPVRKLAEQGISHIQPGYIPEATEAMLRGNAATNRMRASQDLSGIGISPEAQLWETMSDAAVIPGSAKSRIQYHGATNPWLEKLAPEELVHHYSNTTGLLNFSHLTDELRNALNPESGLPRHLQLTPEQIQQMGMEKAVRHVHDINAWRAAQQAEANLAKSQSPAVHMVREYAENNPKGLRWVELRQGDLPEGWVEDMTGVGRMKGYTDPEGKFTIHDPRRQLLADQLKYEGDTMGHCVGGYCDDVAGGKSRIFSLRDAKGEPHVTIETAPPKDLNMREKFLQRIQSEGASQEEAERQASKLFTNLDPTIKQIKGKQNKAPKDDYLPFVQDFVRNHPEGGKWGDIGDFGNTGLVRHIGKRAEALGPYSTEEELTKYLDQFPDPTQNFAEGGLVRENYRPLEFDGVRGYILQ